MIRKASASDIKAIGQIYKNIHKLEQLGKTSTGWIADVYPVEKTAEDALLRDDLFVYEENGIILASAIINQIQVKEYADCDWKYRADDSEIMVLHTLVVEPQASKNGIGSKFVKFYENYACENGCRVLRMDTNSRNLVARRFYKKMDYIESGCVPCIFNGIPDVQLVLLEKKL